MDRWLNGCMNKRHGPPPYTSAFYWKTQIKIQESAQMILLKQACLWGQSKCL